MNQVSYHLKQLRGQRLVSERRSSATSARKISTADQPFDYIITVCDRVREVCPRFPNDPERIHRSFPNPAAVAGSEAERLASFRQVRTPS